MTTMTRDEKAADRRRVLSQDTHPTAKSVAHRVFQTLAAGGVPFDPHPRQAESVRRAAITHTGSTVHAAASHRTRKALAVVLEKLLARGVLTNEDVDDILLAAVDHCEATPIGG
jgi:hypothetical protein